MSSLNREKNYKIIKLVLKRFLLKNRDIFITLEFSQLLVFSTLQLCPKIAILRLTTRNDKKLFEKGLLVLEIF